MNGLALVFLIAVIIGALVLRRKIRDPESTPGRWYKERIKPAEKEIATWFFVATLVLWAALFVGASKEDREKSDQALKGFKESFTSPSTPGKEPAIPKGGMPKQ